MPAILTITPSWDDAFSLFELGQAPMMVSYATDNAYSQYYYGTSKYKVFIPIEGAFVQIEGAGIVNGTKNLELSQIFIEFILTEDFQKEVPLNQWMFPVTSVELPEVYQYAIIPEKILTIPAEEISRNLDKWLEEWEDLIFDHEKQFKNNLFAIFFIFTSFPFFMLFKDFFQPKDLINIKDPQTLRILGFTCYQSFYPQSFPFYNTFT